MPRCCTAIEFDYAILDEAQAIKNAATASAKSARLLRARAPPGAERHANREPSRRTVEPVRVPQSRDCWDRRRRFSARARRAARGDERCRVAVARASSVHPAPDQGAGRAGAAATDRADAALRARTGAAAALRRTARALPRDAARAHRARRRQPIEDADPRSAAAAAAGGMPQRPRSIPARAHEPSAKFERAHSAAARGDRRRAQGAGVFAVHELSGAAPAAARGARACRTNISTAGRAIAPRASNGSRRIRRARCS